MARRRLQRSELPDGRWSVRDVELGTRICNFFQHQKGPNAPSHVHHPEDVYLGPCNVRTAQEAERVMKAYRTHHTALHMAALAEEIERHGDPHDPHTDRP